MKDIDADGDTEVLFALKRHNDQTGEGLLVCYDRLGKERWRFRCDREIASRKKIFSPDYRIAGFFYHDFNGDGRQEIVVESFQAPDWPCQLALLDSSGKVIGEFWNAGYLRDLTYYDINGDGREELIVCGVNNEYQGGCLMVFDPRRISGGSPQTGDYVIKGLAPGSMLYYVTVPYLDVSAAAGDRVDGLRTVDITENHWIRSMTSKGLIYEFDFNLKCLQVSPGNGYVMQHDGQRAAGKLTSVLGEAYNERIREAIRYWNGSAFVAAPSMVVR
jgi:hypothetical protein